MIAELCRRNWNSESCTINTRESRKEISQRRDTIHAKQQAHSVVLRVPWVPFSMGDTWVSKVNMRWTSMKLNKNPWTAVRLLSLPQWLSCWELLLGSDQSSAWLCFMLFCQHWTRNCSQLAILPCFCLISPHFSAIGTEMFPGTATPSTRSCTSSPQTRSQISTVDDQHNPGVYCVLHFYSGYTDSPCWTSKEVIFSSLVSLWGLVMVICHFFFYFYF